MHLVLGGYDGSLVGLQIAAAQVGLSFEPTPVPASSASLNLWFCAIRAIRLSVAGASHILRTPGPQQLHCHCASLTPLVACAICCPAATPLTRAWIGVSQLREGVGVL